MKLLIKKLNSDAIIPVRAHKTDSGLDIFSYLTEDIIIEPLKRVLIPTGIAIKLPDSTIENMMWEAQIRPRSGLASKKGVVAFWGTIDSDFTGELKVILFNYSEESFTVTHGMRIAQLVIQPVALFPIEVVDELESTERGTNGFGSTDVII